MSVATTPTATPTATRPAVTPPVAFLVGCLQALIAANLVQLAAGLAGVEPRPPSNVLPFIAATAVLGLAALPMVRAGERLGYRVAIAFSLISMIGMGPHKLLMADGLVLAPLTMLGFTLELLLIVVAARTLRARP